jgi:hypothetical protein
MVEEAIKALANAGFAAANQVSANTSGSGGSGASTSRLQKIIAIETQRARSQAAAEMASVGAIAVAQARTEYVNTLRGVPGTFDAVDARKIIKDEVEKTLVADAEKEAKQKASLGANFDSKTKDLQIPVTIPTPRGNIEVTVTVKNVPDYEARIGSGP